MSHNRFLFIVVVILAALGIIIATSLRELEASRAGRSAAAPMSASTSW